MGDQVAVAKFDFASWTIEEIKARLAEIRKARAKLDVEEAALVVALDSGEAHLVAGSTSTASMISAEAQISPSKAARLVSFSNSLAELPGLADALSSGAISREVTEQIATFATPENEAEILEVAPNWSATDARDAARAARAITRAEQSRANESRELKFRWSRDKLSVELYGRFGAEGGAKVISGLERIVAENSKTKENEKVPYPAKLADALVQLASLRIGQDADPDRATLCVHVDYETIAGGTGNGEIGGGYVSGEVARRIACDSRLQFVLDDRDGLALGVGRTSRKPPGWLARQIKHRDKVCVFPGCERAFGLDIHHIVHWADGGPTDYDNLVLLCWNHHSLVHEGGWSLTGSVRDGLVFRGLWGDHVEVPPWAKRKKKLRRRSAA